MESESARDSGEHHRDAPLIFISDASAEAERVTVALGARGYVVADVPLALLVGRVGVQRPALVICDADATDTVSTVERLREASKDDPLPVVLLGERDGPMDRIDANLVVAAFARPVNVQELLGTIERIAGIPEVEPGPSSMSGGRGAKIATSSRPPARGSSPSVAPQQRSVRTEAASPPPMMTAIPLPPDLAGDGAPREEGAPVVELSLEIQAVLTSAEQRLTDSRGGAPSGGEEPGPEANAEGPLPPEILSALDEPLDEEDVGDDGSSADHPRDGTAALTGARLGAFGTRVGRTGTNLGTEGAEDADLPESRPSGAPGPRAGIAGPALEMPAHPPPPAPLAPEQAEGQDDASEPEGARLARQQASTPKPPRPGPEDRGFSDTPASLNVSVPPPATTAEPSLPPESRAGTGVGKTSSDIRDPARELTSTTPPLHRREERAEERVVVERRSEFPEPGHLTRIERPSERPASSPLKEDRASERPASRPLADRPSDPPGSAPSSVEAEPPRGRGAEVRPAPKPTGGRDDAGALTIPTVLRAGDTITALAGAIRTRFTGAIALEVDEGIRRIVFREGDFVTVASGVHGESLVAFLAGRGDIPADVARQAHKLPAFGRRAGAALIAQGHLAQDELWSVLRAHAEWLVGRACRIVRGGAGVEDQLIDRLKDEPGVFGGATGAEVLVDVVRRVVPPEEALERLGGPSAVLGRGAANALLGECALGQSENEHVQNSLGQTVGEALEGAPDPSLASAFYALVALGVLATEGARARPAPAPKKVVRDEIDDDALRERILSRKALVDEGDYFSLLGVTRDATGYDIRRAYTSLRREFEPSRLLTSATADLGDVVVEIVEVLEEAYEVLGDQQRRERYRRAIEATP